jgi:hypothetical protein
VDQQTKVIAFLFGFIAVVFLFFGGYRLGHNSAEDACRDYYADRSYTEVQKLCRDITWRGKVTQ